MNNFFGLDVKDLVELAKTLEEKAKEGEIKTSFEVKSGPMRNIPKQGNIPRAVGRNSDPTQTGQPSQETNFTVQSPKTDGANSPSIFRPSVFPSVFPPCVTADSVLRRVHFVN